MTTLGSWLKGEGFTVEDSDVPYGRDSTWHGVDWIVVHHTVSDDDGSESSIASYIRNGGSGTYPPLAQIMLGQSGKVWMCSKERSGQSDPGRASHAGNGNGYGVPVDSMNAYSLGIECQCDGSHKLATHATLYQTLIELCAALCRRYGLDADHVIGHKEWSSTGKVDPRDDMDEIRADVAAELEGEGAPYVTEHVYRSKCGYLEPTNGDDFSDTVKELQERLNRIILDGGQDLVVTGRYDADTDEEVRLWQEQICHDPPDPPGQSFLGPLQFAEMFPDSIYVLHDDGDPAIAGGVPPEPEPTPPPDEVEPPESITFPLGIEYHYSGKPAGTFTFSDTKKFLDVEPWAPTKQGFTFGMLYANVDIDGEFRSFLERMDPSDETAFQTHFGDEGGDNYLLTHVWFEKGEAGRRLRYGLYSMDGQTGTVGTRYVKFLAIPEDIFVDLGNVLAIYTAARQAYRVAVDLLPKELVAAFVGWVMRVLGRVR